MYVANSFSLNMLADLSRSYVISVIPLSKERVIDTLSHEEIVSAVGHEDTAAIFSDVLGLEIPMNRQTLVLKKKDQVIVGQYCGPRRPEGERLLPPGATIKWLLVDIR